MKRWITLTILMATGLGALLLVNRTWTHTERLRATVSSQTATLRECEMLMNARPAGTAS